MANDVSYFKVQGDETQYSFNDANVEAALLAEIARAQAAESDNADAISAEATRAETAEGDLSTLSTTAKGSLVAAINEVDGNIGDLSKLTTTAKDNLVAALNEQNSNILSALAVRYALGVPATTIPSSADLNSYTSIGQYVCASAVVASSLSNTPYKSSGFKLTVEQLSNAGHIMQTIKGVNSAYFYYRTYAGTWNSWRTVGS